MRRRQWISGSSAISWCWPAWRIGQATGREGSVFDVVACLYSTSGICGLVASVAVLAGKTAYEPLLFWFGLAGLILGVLFRFTAKPSGAT